MPSGVEGADRSEEIRNEARAESVDPDAGHPVHRGLREHGIADDDSFVVGSTLTVPLRDGGAPAVIAAVDALELGALSVGARKPTLDDVYLRLTGGRLADAA